MANILIGKEDWENEDEIKVWNVYDCTWEKLNLALKRVNFTEKQAELLEDIFHKILQVQL